MGYAVYAFYALMAYEAYDGIQERKKTSSAYESAANEQKKANREQDALNFQKRTEERRNLVREERVRRARLLQAAENTGASYSSGEAGALGSMNTQLQSNLGANAASADIGGRLSGYLQNAADFNTAAQKSAMAAQNADQLFSIFGKAAGSMGGAGGAGAGGGK